MLILHYRGSFHLLPHNEASKQPDQVNRAVHGVHISQCKYKYKSKYKNKYENKYKWPKVVLKGSLHLFPHNEASKQLNQSSDLLFLISYFLKNILPISSFLFS